MVSPDDEFEAYGPQSAAAGVISSFLRFFDPLRQDHVGVVDRVNMDESGSAACSGSYEKGLARDTMRRERIVGDVSLSV